MSGSVADERTHLDLDGVRFTANLGVVYREPSY